ncbi:MULTISPECIES: hypothetical protein [Bacillaceae]|uniref:Lipoprotein n=1 Tax=Evansella alkalicola TaxID=745819 RepID=A0ABS6K011_9BACI|nr:MULTISPECIES: hypothetical protein [Bacillaceae]MBU9722802.1 hypothetical protein [Bacillus alkalicola]
MKRGLILGMILVLSFLTACSMIGRSCPDGEIEWVDTLMLNDVNYTGEDEGFSNVDNLKEGSKIGEVEFMLADNACSNHRLRNGDAAFLPVGTEVFEIVGYDPTFRVFANGRLYQVRENENADTIRDLYDIEGRVQKLSLESTYDGRQLLDFTQDEMDAFIEDFLTLDYVGFHQIYERISTSNSTFLRIHLDDGTSFRISYWLDENALNPGAYGTERMKTIIEKNVR